MVWLGRVNGDDKIIRWKSVPEVFSALLCALCASAVKSVAVAIFRTMPESPQDQKPRIRLTSLSHGAG
jgi:hypothetical protein